MVAVVIVVFAGAFNDWQKERQFSKLNRKKDDRVVKVRRSGKTVEVSVYKIFPGDVMVMEAGDVVPVDGIFIDGHNVKCDESSATGESDHIKKTPAHIVYQALDEGGLSATKKMDPYVLSGARVSDGVGEFLVTAVGVHSSHGKTMMSLREDNDITPLQYKLNILAGYIAKLGSAAGLILFSVLLILFLTRLDNPDQNGDPRDSEDKAQDFLNILIMAVTIVVVAVPEGLPLAVTLALAFATKRMTKDNNLVRHLQSCETMGNATVICSDKTGTLTQNVMTVVAGALGKGTLRFGDKDKLPKGGPSDSLSASDASDDSHRTAQPITEVPLYEIHDNTPQGLQHLIKELIAINSTAFEGEHNDAFLARVKRIHLGNIKSITLSTQNPQS